MEYYIQSLEDIVIALSESEDDSVEHRIACKMFKKIKQKRIDRSNKMSKDSNTSDESNTVRRSSRFRKNNKQHRPRFYTIEPKQKIEFQEQ